VADDEVAGPELIGGRHIYVRPAGNRDPGEDAEMHAGRELAMSVYQHGPADAAVCSVERVRKNPKVVGGDSVEYIFGTSSATRTPTCLDTSKPAEAVRAEADRRRTGPGIVRFRRDASAEKEPRAVLMSLEAAGRRRPRTRLSLRPRETRFIRTMAASLHRDATASAEIGSPWRLVWVSGPGVTRGHCSKVQQFRIPRPLVFVFSWQIHAVSTSLRGSKRDGDGSGRREADQHREPDRVAARRVACRATTSGAVASATPSAVQHDPHDAPEAASRRTARPPSAE